MQRRERRRERKGEMVSKRRKELKVEGANEMTSLVLETRSRRSRKRAELEREGDSEKEDDVMQECEESMMKMQR